MLKGLDVGCKPKDVIAKLAEDLLEYYAGKDLVNQYDVYQHLMDYWSEVMQDDCYLIAADGWQAMTYRVMEKNKAGKEVDKGWVCDLVPKGLMVTRYFAGEQGAIDAQQAELEAVMANMEEHGGDEGAFGEKVLVVDDKWLARVGGAIAGEMDRVSVGLTSRVKVVAERYDRPLPEMVGRVVELEELVAGHLRQMGFGV